MTVFGVLPRYVAREILVHALGVVVVALGIFLVRRFGSLLGDATQGALPLIAILHLLVLRTIMALPSLMPAVVYVAVLLGLGRLYRDNEMTALAACGVRPARTSTAVLALASFAAVFIGVLSFSVRPWAASRFEEVKGAALADANLGNLRPGRFYELDRDGKLVLFAERRSRDDRRAMENVFVQDGSGGRLAILSSSRAVEYRDAERGDRIVQLLEGYRYDLAPDGTNLEITEYEELVIRTPLADVEPEDSSERARSAVEILSSTDPQDVAEVQWRLAMPVSTLVLALLALPLSRIDPRGGRAAKLFLALLLYTLYRNLLSTTKTWVAMGVVAPLPGTWAVHAGCLAAALALFALQRSIGDARLTTWGEGLGRWAWQRARIGRERAGQR